MQELDLLILGAGWTSTFLLPLLRARHLTHAATTTTGRSNTLKFRFDPTATDPSYFSALPAARNILVTFPLVGTGQSALLTSSYKATHPRTRPRWLQLGSTGIWQTPDDAGKGGEGVWMDRHSAYDASNARAVAEDELLGLGGCVVDLAGLWGGERDPRHWVDRVAGSKEQLKGKTSLHMVHGEDVARAILAVFTGWDKGRCEGQRWMLTDGMVYDWWELILGWAKFSKLTAEEKEREKEPVPSPQSQWVYELMEEQGVRALPRSMEALGRCYDSREFWITFGLTPIRSRI